MNKEQFCAMLTLIIPQIIELILKYSNVPDTVVISRFYRSKLYEELSNEETKLWHYSALNLYTMFQDELLTGSYDYPEES